MGADEEKSARLPAYQRVKEHILTMIRSGAWAEGEMIPSEINLANDFGVSRMTANRALRELSQDNIVSRVPGSGTFVAQQKRESTLIRLQNIVEEIEERGGLHRGELHLAERVKADKPLAQQFELTVGDTLLHTVVVHFENDIPIQVEDRFVNASLAPDYLDINFRTQTANEYLLQVAPLQGVEFVIESLMPTAAIAKMLAIDQTQSCLVLKRTTRSRGHIASTATLWHPGSRYRFSGSF